MNKYKITENEINENNVKSAADLLRGEPRDNKNIFDRLPELIANKVNGFIDAVISKFTDYYTKNEINNKETALSDRINAKANSADVYAKSETYTKAETDTRLNAKANADSVYTKEQTYSKEETSAAINEKVNELGAGDMAKAVYDKNNNGVVDDAEKLNGQPASYYASKAEVQTAQTTADNAWSLAGGKEVASNTDLNTVTAVGNYYCMTNNSASTMSNIPRKAAFTLKVESTTGAVGENSQTMYRRQIWQGFNTEAGTYERTGETANGGSTWTWGEWEQHLTSENKMDLLWTNASQSSEFAPQTISLDLSNYKFVLIVFHRSASSPKHLTCIAPIGYIHIAEFTEGKPETRNYQTLSNGIKFEEGYVWNSFTTMELANRVIIPYQIFGIK